MYCSFVNRLLRNPLRLSRLDTWDPEHFTLKKKPSYFHTKELDSNVLQLLHKHATKFIVKFSRMPSGNTKYKFLIIFYIHGFVHYR
jgi:hypothetical protein